MASRPLANPLFPDVPALPGVPPVFRGPLNPAGTSSRPPPALTADSLGSTPVAAAWGLYNVDGTVALKVDSIVTLEPSREYRISDYPVERGGFASYNKVALPGELRVAVTKGGSDADRNAFLTALDVLVATRDLLNVVTPDTAFTDVNLVHYDYHRASDGGATLLRVELHFVEVRQSAKSKFSDSKAPSGADLKNDGPVQTAVPTVAQTPPAGVTYT